MNFKDLQYSIGRLTTDVRSHMARNNPLQKQDTKALSMWIFNERNNLATMRTLAYQQSETIKVFQQWTKEELLNDKDDNGRDIEVSTIAMGSGRNCHHLIDSLLL